MHIPKSQIKVTSQNIHITDLKLLIHTNQIYHKSNTSQIIHLRSMQRITKLYISVNHKLKKKRERMLVAAAACRRSPLAMCAAPPPAGRLPAERNPASRRMGREEGEERAGDGRRKGRGRRRGRSI